MRLAKTRVGGFDSHTPPPADVSRPTVHVVVNPVAGRGRGGRAADEVSRALGEIGAQREVFRTQGPGDASAIAARLARQGAARILVVGGDGTVHEVANGLLRQAVGAGTPALAVHPVGTGNDFARTARSSRDAAESARRAARGAVVRLDAGRATWAGGQRFFVNLLGFGVDVEVLRRRARFSRISGLAQYMAAFATAVVRYRPPSAKIELGGEAISGAVTIAAFTCGRTIGGGFMISPAAEPADGRLDLCHVPALGLLQVAPLALKAVRGTHGRSKHVTMRRLERATVKAAGEEAIWFEVDGELLPEPLPELRVEVVPRALGVLMPGREGA